jgi:hypothetical protein
MDNKHYLEIIMQEMEKLSRQKDLLFQRADMRIRLARGEGRLTDEDYKRMVEASKAIMRISYKISPEVWVSYAESVKNRTACTKYPVGMICPTCGDKEKIVREAGTTICKSCRELFAYKATRADDGDFIATIKKII